MYFFFTILFYVSGQFEWLIPSYFKLIFYLLICYCFLNVGYSFRIIDKFHISKTYFRDIQPLELDFSKIKTLFYVSGVFLIFSQILWVVTFLNTFNVFNILETIGSNYFERLNVTFESNVITMQIRTLLWGLSLFVYPIGFLYYKNLHFKEKLFFCSVIFVDILSSLNMGISKNIGDIVICYIASALLQNISEKRCYLKRRGVKIIGTVLSFLLVFGLVQYYRGLSSNVYVYNPYAGFAVLRDSSLLYDFIGNGTLIGKIGLYVSHAYTGLAYALELPFENTYLIGFSRALTEYFQQYSNISVADLTYNARIEAVYGWKNGIWWPTAFVWIGNSVSLYLVPFVLFFLGLFIRYLEDDYGKSGNIYTAVLYSQMVITLFYLPCNMQVFQSRQSFFGMILLLFLFCFRYKFQKKLIK